MVDLIQDADRVVITDVQNTSRYRVRWRLSEVHAGCFALRSVTVFDTLGVDPDFVLCDSDSVWGSVGQFLPNDVSYADVAQEDQFIGFDHNKEDQVFKNGYTVADGNVVTGDEQNAARVFVHQTHDFYLPSLNANGDRVYGGEAVVHYIFEPDHMILQQDWNVQSGINVKTLYGAMAVVTAGTANGGRVWDIEGKPPYTIANDGSSHFTSDPHAPLHFVARSDAHRFELHVELPHGPGRLQGGQGTYEYATLERAFLSDNAVTPANPNGVCKLYAVFYSGEQEQPAESTSHMLKVSVKLKGDTP